VKLLTDLQILGSELHKNALGGRALLGRAGGAIALPKPYSRYQGERRDGRGRKGLGIGMERKGREGREGVGRNGKGK